MRRWRSFPVQLFVLIVFPLVALLLIITLGSLTLHQQAMRNMVGERDERAIRAAAAAISEQLNHRHSAIRSLALQVAVTHDPEHALADATFYYLILRGGSLYNSGDPLSYQHHQRNLANLVYSWSVTREGKLPHRRGKFLAPCNRSPEWRKPSSRRCPRRDIHCCRGLLTGESGPPGPDRSFWGS